MVFPRRIRAVVFDMDGLLVDTEALIRDIYVELAVARGVSMPDHVFHRMIGLPNAASDAVARAHFGAGLPAGGAARRRHGARARRLRSRRGAEGRRGRTAGSSGRG